MSASDFAVKVGIFSKSGAIMYFNVRAGNYISNAIYVFLNLIWQFKMYRDCNLLFQYYNFLYAAALSKHLKLGVKTAAINTSLNNVLSKLVCGKCID